MIASVLTRMPRMLRCVIFLLVPLLLVASAIGVGRIIEAGAQSQANWRNATRKALAYGRAARQAVPEIVTALEALPAEPVWQRLYVGERSESNQAAMLADVWQVLAQSGIQNPKVDPVPTKQTHNVQIWGCEASFLADAVQLHALAQNLRSLPRLVRVQGIVINSPPMQTLGDNPVSSIKLTLEGFGTRKAIAAKPE